MIDLVIGAGQGGSRIAKAFSEVYDIEGRYLNLADVDFASFTAPRHHTFVIDGKGTGRDPLVGEQLVRSNMSQVKEFIAAAIKSNKAKSVVLCVGGGGGSGTGYMFPLLDYLLSKRREIILVYTLPQKKEGLPAVPNALRSVNRLIETYIGRGLPKESQIVPLLVDNDYCFEKYGESDRSDGKGAGYWSRLNEGIARALQRFYYATTLGSDQLLNAMDGYNTLDYREFLKILFFKDGFLDIREAYMSHPSEAASIGKALRTSSLLSGSMNINTTKAYIVSVAIPDRWRKYAHMPEYVAEVFDSVSRLTRTPYVLKSSYFSARLEDRATVSLLLAGVTKSHSLDKHLKNALHNIEVFKSKGDCDLLDTSGLEI